MKASAENLNDGWMHYLAVVVAGDRRVVSVERFDGASMVPVEDRDQLRARLGREFVCRLPA